MRRGAPLLAQSESWLAWSLTEGSFVEQESLAARAKRPRP